MTDLIRYDAACRAIAAARSIDEAKDLSDKAEALRAYARQAKNRQLEVDAAEIRIRAERRLGELIALQKAAEGLDRGGGDTSTGARKEPVQTPPKLADLGVDKKLSSRAQKMAAVPEGDFEGMLADWRGRIERENERVTTNLLKAGAKAGRRENDLYPTPPNIIATLVRRWQPKARLVWEPCCGDERVAEALYTAGYEVFASDLSRGQDFFAYETVPPIGAVGSADKPALCTNPPFGEVRRFIDHAFAIGIEEMALVLPERLWACGEGSKQFERHRPRVWANLDWREDYLGLGGSPDRALAVGIWDSPCAETCAFEVWSRDAEVAEERQAETPAPQHEEPELEAAPAAANTPADDDLEIPAFLRRRAGPEGASP